MRVQQRLRPNVTETSRDRLWLLEHIWPKTEKLRQSVVCAKCVCVRAASCVQCTSFSVATATELGLMLAHLFHLLFFPQKQKILHVLCVL